MVRARRRAVGLTLAELSERAGLSANYLQTIEAGTRDVSLSSLEAIASALGVTPGELLGDVQRLTPDALQAGRLIDTLEPEAREVALRLLRLFRKATQAQFPHEVSTGLKTSTHRVDPRRKRSALRPTPTHHALDRLPSPAPRRASARLTD